MHEQDVRIAALARGQHGLFTRAQAARVGFTRRMMRRRVDNQSWEEPHDGVFRLAGLPVTWEGRARAAVMTAHDGAVISHHAAAHVSGWDGFGPPGLIDVTVPRHVRPMRRAGVRYHESKAFELVSVTLRKGLPITGAARTILDVCAMADDDLVGLRALDEARRRGVVSWDELWECLVLHAVRGRPGIRRFRRILVKRWRRSVPHGQFARLFERLIDDAGLPQLTHEYRVTAGGAPYRIDLVWPELKIAIELDGKEGHLNERSFESDPIRRNRLEVAGWLVLDYTWLRFITEPAAIVAELRAAIAARRATGV